MLRIKNQDQLNRFLKEGKIAKPIAKQISKNFQKVNDKSNDGFVNSRHSSVIRDQELRQSRANFCLLPQYDKRPDPISILYRACIKRWGRHYEGGLVVWELVIKAPRAFRLDIAIPKYRIGIELDGFIFHSSKSAIAKDHEKLEQLGRLGWVIFKIGVKRTLNDLDTFLDSIDHLIKNSNPQQFSVKENKPNNGKVSFFSTLVIDTSC